MIVKRTPCWPDPSVKPPFGSVELDRAHPLAPSVCFLLNEGAGDVVDLALSLRGVFESRTNTTWQPTMDGVGVTFNTAGASTIDLTSSQAQYATPPPFSVEVWWNWQTANKNTYSGPMLNRVASQAGFQLIDQGNGAGTGYNPSILPWNGTAEQTAAAAYFPLQSRPFNKKFLFTCVDYSTRCLCYVDGVAQTFQAGTGGGWGTASKAVNIGDGYQPIAGTIMKVSIWPRVLTANEAAWLTAEPFVFLRPIIRRRYFVPAAGPTIIEATFSAAGAAAVAGVSGAIAGSALTAAGIAAMTNAGAAVWLGTLVSAGVATVAADSQAVTVVGADASAAGVATLAAESQAVGFVGADLTAAGLATVAGVSGATVGSAFASAGVATVTGRGADASIPPPTISSGRPGRGAAFRFERGRGRP